MAEGNYVRITVQASDQAAAADLDDLKARLDEMGAKVDTARVDVDDADAEVKLDRMRARLLTLGEQVSRPKVTVAGVARAEAELGALQAQLAGLDAEEGGGFLVNLFGPNGLNPGNIAALGTGMAVVAPAIAAVLVELTGVVAGLAAATAGVGALALVALPTFEKVKTALSDTPAELKKQPALIQDIVGKIRGLETAFGKIATAMQPQLLAIFNTGLKVAAQLMPVIAKFAQAAAPAVEEVMKSLSKSIDSQGFKDFADKFSKLSGPSIEAIGQGFGKVAAAVGHLFTVMSAHDVVHALNVAFDILAGTINLFATWVGGAMRNWDNFSSHMQQIAHTIVSNWQSMLGWFEGLPGSFGQIIRNIENWWDSLVSWFKGLPSRIVAALSGLAGMLYNAGANAVQHLIDGLMSKIGSLGSAAASLAKKVAGFFGLSPAVEGPLSGGGAPEIRGQHFALDFARGIQSGVAGVGTAASRLAGAAGGTVASGGAAGTGQLEVVLSLAGGAGNQLATALLQQLRATVRTVGGGGPNSVQRTLGQTS